MSYRAYLVLLAALTAAVVAIRLGESRALNPHEIYVAETASEMLAGRDLLVPRFNGSVRIEKPPLSYWLAIAAHKIVGERARPWVSELEARLPSLLAAGALLFVTFELGAVAFEPRVGLVAAALLATSWDFFSYARSARPEMLYTLLCVLQALGLLLALRRAQEGRSTARAALLVWSAFAAALLAKGPQVPVFLLAGALLALLTVRPRPSFRETFHPWIGVVAVAVVAPYFVYVATQTEHALSVWSAEIVQDKPLAIWLRPFQLYYPFAILAGLVPWAAVLGYTVVHCWKHRDSRATLLIACILVTLFFLSFAGKLRRHYVLPALPLCAVLMARALIDLRERGVRHEGAGSDAAARARSAMQRLFTAQAAFVALGIVGIAWLTFFTDPCNAVVAWTRALVLLIVAAVLAWLAFIERGVRPARAWTTLVAAVLVTWCAVASAGIDSSARWAAQRRFAREIRDAVPGKRTLIYDSGTLEPLVYYGGLRLEVRRYEQWCDAWDGAVAAGPPPLFICEGRCTSHGVPAGGRVLAAAPKCGKYESMMLFQPSRARQRQSMRHTCGG